MMKTSELQLFRSDGLINEQARDLLVSNGIVPYQAEREQIEYFFRICQQYGLNPLLKEAHLVPYNTKNGNEWITKYAVIVGKDAYIKFANETGLFAGIDEPQFNKQSNGRFKTAAEFQKGEYPKTCTMTVYKVVAGQRVPFTTTVKFSEFAKIRKNKDGKYQLQGNWATMPFQMIAKVATVHALKMAFSGQVPQGTFIEEEIPAVEATTQNAVEVLGAEPEIDSKELLKIAKQAEARAKKAKTVEELLKIFDELPDAVKHDDSVLEMFREQRERIEKSSGE